MIHYPQTAKHPFRDSNMAKQFYGREYELDLLKQQLRSRKAKLIVLRGRRRVGKSRLLAEFSKNFNRTFEFSGLPPGENIGPTEQRVEFAELLARQAKCAVTCTDDWSHLFWLVSEQITSEKTLIIFDEITWMAEGDATFLPKLKNAWDLYFSRMPNVIFALSGSLSLWIEKNILSSTGYLGRIDLKLIVEQLPLSVCRQFWGKNNKWSAFDMLKFLSVSGGIPKYLELIDPKLSAEDNINRHCFDQNGFLYDEFENIFSDLFEKKNGIYTDIVKALVTGSKQLEQILKSINREKGGVTTEYLNDLEKSGFISIDYSWDIKKGKISRTRMYRLADNYSRFYLKYILPYKSQLKTKSTAMNITQLPQWSSVLGLQFENLVLANRDLVLSAIKLHANDVVCINPYFQRKNSKQEGCQVDLLIQTRFDTLYLCEIKFSKNEVGLPVMTEVQEKIKKLKVPKNFSVLPVLIHVNGVSEQLEDEQFFTYMINFSQFMKG